MSVNNVKIVQNPYNKRISDGGGGNFLDPFPVGYRVPWLGDTPPDKGYIMKGQLVQRNEAPELYDFAVKNNLIKSETDWQEQKLYGFFSSGDNETTFRLPLYVGYKTIGYDETQHTLGKPLDPALPNITGQIYATIWGGSNGRGIFTSNSGSFQLQGNSLPASNVSGAQGRGRTSFSFNAASSSEMYKDGITTVQTPDIPENWVIKYKS